MCSESCQPVTILLAGPLRQKTHSSLTCPGWKRKSDTGLKMSSFFLFLRFFFWCGPFFFFKSLLNLLQYRFCFMFCFFWPWGMWDVAPQQRIQPASPALKGKVFTTRDRQGSPCLHFKMWNVGVNLVENSWRTLSTVARKMSTEVLPETLGDSGLQGKETWFGCKMLLNVKEKCFGVT